MIQVKIFTVNFFYINSLLLYDETGECIIVDPGYNDPSEKQMLQSFISKNDLNPVKLINTHCHIDHILGNRFIFDEYGLKPEIHKDELVILTSTNSYANIFNMPSPNSPLPDIYLEDNSKITFGKSEMEIIWVPGHTPGHINLFARDEKFIVCGDVLFRGSIGRTDLPGGDYDTIINSINSRLMVLPDDVKVYSGHGEPTSIGYERKYNPFLNY